MSYPTITGVGLAVPEHLVTNKDFVEITGLPTSDEAIQRLTGIEQRYWIAGAAPHATILGATAARGALDMANIGPGGLGSIYLSTASPDNPSPSVASRIHSELSAPENCGALDINAACAGGVFALKLGAAEMMIEEDCRALIIGSEILSFGINREDRRSAILFGDGAGAAVLENQVGANRPYFATMTRPDIDAIYVPPAGHAKTDPNQESTIQMNGKKVGDHAGYVMSTLAKQVAERAKLMKDNGSIEWDGIDYFIPHQANMRLIEGLGDYLEVPEDKRIITVQEFGNTSSASILMALRAAYDREQIEPGRKRVLFTSIGAGMVGAAAIMDINLPKA